MSKDQRIQALSGRFEQMRFVVLDTVPKTFNDGNMWRTLWDPDGHHREDGAKEPSGELVDQFLRFPVGKYKDIPDALADLDVTDKDGRRICMGSGRREEIRDELMTRPVPQPMLSYPDVMRATSRGPSAKWNRLAGRTGGGRYGRSHR